MKTFVLNDTQKPQNFKKRKINVFKTGLKHDKNTFCQY